MTMVYLVMEDDNVKGVYATLDVARKEVAYFEDGVTAHRHTYSIVAREVHGGPVAATVVKDAIPVLTVEGVNREMIRVAIPGGYDDVKKYSKLVLDFEGRTYTFTGWNSDTLEAYFKTGGAVATMARKR